MKGESVTKTKEVTEGDGKRRKRVTSTGEKFQKRKCQNRIYGCILLLGKLIESEDVFIKVREWENVMKKRKKTEHGRDEKLKRFMNI